MSTATDRRFGLPHMSLRSPMSYPEKVAAVNSYQEESSLAETPDSATSIRAQPVKEKKQQIARNNVLDLSGELALFKAQKPRPTTCHNCGLYGARRCSNCHVTYYCSEKCQAEDWKAHVIFCKPSNPEVTGREKIMNGEKPKVGTKPDSMPSPEARNNEADTQRIMFSDLPRQTHSEGTETQAYVSEFLSPSNFFIQVYSEKSVENLMNLCSSLKNTYSSPDYLKKAYEPSVGEICVAKYAQDQLWYRAVVCSTEIMSKTAQVLYLDFGNKEVVSFSDLQPVHKDIPLLPPCAMNCRIAHVVEPPCGWAPECLAHMKRLLVGQQLLFRIVRMELAQLPRYLVEVTLPESGELVHEIMLKEGYSVKVPAEGAAGAVPAADRVPERPAQEKAELAGQPDSTELQNRPDTSCTGSRYKVLMTVFHNPGMFFCQKVQNTKLLAELEAAVNQRCSAAPNKPGFLPQVGEVCCAKFTEDGNWYRASVVGHSSKDSVVVGYLDFGNTETLHVSRLLPIDKDLLVTPFLAFQCGLAGVEPPSGTWSPEAVQKIGRLLLNRIFTAEVVSEPEGHSMLNLIDESQTPPLVISQQLIEAGLAKASTSDCSSAPSPEKEEEHEEPQLQWVQLPPDQETEVVVCMLINPGKFFCHIYNPTDLSTLNDLNLSLGEHCKQHVSEGCRPVTGDMCATFFSDDGNWYRGQVKDVTPGGAFVVQFLDYGNTEEVTADKLCKVPSEFLKLPFQALSCSLHGVKPAGEEWDLHSSEKFQKAVVGVKLRARMISRRENDYSVHLAVSETGDAIADILVGEGVASRDASKADDTTGAKSTIEARSAVTSDSQPGLSTKTQISPIGASPAKELRGPSLREQQHLVQPANTSLPSTTASGQSHPVTPPTSRESKSSLPPQKECGPVGTPPSPRELRNPAADRNKSSNSCVPPSPSTPMSSRTGNITRTADVTASAVNRAIFPKDKPSSPRDLTSNAQCSTVNPASQGEQLNSKPNRPVLKEPPTSHLDQSGICLTEASSASELLPSKNEDLLNCPTTGDQTSVLPAPTGVRMAQSWVSVDLPLSEPLAACVLKVESPDMIYLFPKENRVDVEKLSQVMLDIMSYCNAEALQSDYTPCVGDACCAKFTGDGQWYRAIVMEVSEATAGIVYADYGNLETLPFSDLRPIKESFLCPPIQLACCRLDGVAPISQHWPPEATQVLSSLLVGAEVTVTAHSVSAGIYSVSMEKLQETGAVRVEEKLVMDGLAKHADVLPLTAEQKERDGCCCQQEVIMRIEKLEQLLVKLLQRLG
ncbi:tudor domain-containing protein 1 isoform X2 [Hyperolius riggenbachi]|uniref:tudor domain-containing protein 1 isoform X2 n=1 Tax=Hyperolius riggenbachi TaxID=752182 RepID=UPI0035A3BAC0